VGRPLILSNPTGNGLQTARPCLSGAKPRYTLVELLARSDYSESQPTEEREWIDAPAVGRELP
jgi:hypothetical protein